MRVSTSMPERYQATSTRTAKECLRSWVRREALWFEWR